MQSKTLQSPKGREIIKNPGLPLVSYRSFSQSKLISLIYCFHFHLIEANYKCYYYWLFVNNCFFYYNSFYCTTTKQLNNRIN